MNYKSVAGVVGCLTVLTSLVSLGDGSATGLGLLAPLIPVAQITGHAGLWAHGLTSAALLKLKAAGALAGLFLLSGRGIEVNFGNEGGGWGWEQAKRRKRDVDGVAQFQRRDDPYDPSLDEVLAYDQLGCGLRFVCEMSATPLNQLGEDERVILELFGQDGKAPLHPSKTTKGKLSYTYASILGAYAKDGVRACGRVYGQCPYSRNQIIQQLRAARF